ncbi:hypothetical protein IH979_00965, partial [Patescibacteria group bacterium]|nr:hypothetical protein [Patescibacteria group bacterium]
DRPRKKSGKGKCFILILLILLVAVALIFVFGFRQEGPVTEDQEVEEVSPADVGQEVKEVGDDQDEEELETIDLTSLVGADFGGLARRGVERDLFTHVVIATLPAIDLQTQ